MNVDEHSEHRAFALPGASPRYGPDKTVDVERIDLHLVPDLERAHLAGVCTLTVRALDEPVAILSLDAVDLSIDRVEREDAAQRFTHRGPILEIVLDPPIAPAEVARLTITYSVTRPRHGMFFIEPTREYPKSIRHLWTQSQDENARYWFPCLDYPHEKQRTSTTVVVPKGQFALANGALVERRDEGDRTIFRYEESVPHATYLMTLVVGPFIETTQRAGEKPVLYYVLPGRQSDGERAFAGTPKMIDVFEERIGTPYPYERYSQIAVSDFIFGGMENTSATTQTDRTLHDERAHLDFSSDPLVAHELAHQWFGDLLTCRDWSHAWLNEGFATYFEAVYREADLGSDEYLYDVFGCLERYLEEDADRYRRPIVCNQFRDPIEIFDRHLYEKGAAVLHMLRGELGDARFWRSIRRYVADNAERSVETIDFIRAIERATGRNMRGFFDQWVFQGGHPRLKIGVSYDAARRAITIAIDQEQRVDAEHPPYRFETDLAVVEGASHTERRVRITVERAHETIAIPVDGEPELVRFDPGAFVLGDVRYAFGDRYAARALAGDSDVVARVRAARELAKSGSFEARAAIRNAFQTEAFWGVLVETAKALADTREPWARDVLLSAIAHAHPKVRRAVVAGLGNYRDTGVADALLQPAQSDRSYFVQAAALTSLGKTRDPRAFAVLRAAIGRETWNGVVESGAAHGLSELADSAATALLEQAAALGRDEGLRRAAVLALARHAELVEKERTRAVETLQGLLDDPMFLVSLSAIAAAERLADVRFLGALDRLAAHAFDGRVRRDAAEAAIRIREAQKVPAQVTLLRSDLEALREDQKKLRELLWQKSEGAAR